MFGFKEVLKKNKGNDFFHSWFYNEVMKIKYN